MRPSTSWTDRMALRGSVCVLAVLAANCRVSDRTPESSSRGVQQAGMAVAEVPFRVPADSEVSDPAVLASLRRGRALLRDTRDSLPKHVGNRLNCVSCHAGNGAQMNAIALVGVYSRYPQFRPRGGRVDLIEDRVNDCFERSLNGIALDMRGRDMRDMVTYMAFLSRGVPAGARVEGQGVWMLDPPLKGDTSAAAPLFAASCAACHGADGQGTAAAPPLWGPHSYNVGAGMARVQMAAGFIRSAMPMTAPGSLTPQQAYDLATYINSRPRPDYAKKSLDWPNGNAPPDLPSPAVAIRAKKTD